ncbi:MAG TPA: histidine kinase [Burkholderiaceae bacterium]|nr:histidine kinase [Burkholderiaceae bacterium]
MSAVPLQTSQALPAPVLSAARRRTIRVTSGHVVAVLLATLVTSVLDLAYLFDKLGKPGIWKVIAFEPVVSVLIFTSALLAWLVVAAQPSGRTRWSPLVAAAVASAALTAAVTMPISSAAGIDQVWQSLMEKTRPMPPDWLRFIGNTAHLSIYAFLFIAAAQNLRHRSATQRAVLAAQRAHASIAREVLEARLIAMQAQVEPQFLFDSLVDIETLYRRNAPQAPQDLDRLITYLRVALPRMREAGSTIEAEIDLVKAYLAVVTSLHAGRPALYVTLPDECRSARFYPMLFLPLVQRAVRQPSGEPPASIRIGISRIDNQVVTVLRFDHPAGCADDAELTRVRERLAGLYDGAASLECEEHDRMVQLTMRVPAAFGTDL